VLLSAAPGHEFVDWGRQAHLGGGSHGSLHASDSLGALILAGVSLPERASQPEPASGRPEPASATASETAQPGQWAIRDVAALVLEHFGLNEPV
jgi:hypothetical protein